MRTCQWKMLWNNDTRKRLSFLLIGASLQAAQAPKFQMLPVCPVLLLCINRATVVLRPSMLSHCLTPAVLQSEFNIRICHLSLFKGVPSVVVFVLYNTSCRCFQAGHTGRYYRMFAVNSLYLQYNRPTSSQPSLCSVALNPFSQQSPASYIIITRVCCYTLTQNKSSQLYCPKVKCSVDCMNSSDVESDSSSILTGIAKNIFCYF